MDHQNQQTKHKDDGNAPSERKTQSLPRLASDVIRPTQRRRSSGERELRVLVLGNAGVGKTGESLFCQQTHVESGYRTIYYQKYYQRKPKDPNLV